MRSFTRSGLASVFAQFTRPRSPGPSVDGQSGVIRERLVGSIIGGGIPSPRLARHISRLSSSRAEIALRVPDLTRVLSLTRTSTPRPFYNRRDERGKSRFNENFANAIAHFCSDSCRPHALFFFLQMRVFLLFSFFFFLCSSRRLSTPETKGGQTTRAVVSACGHPRDELMTQSL